MEEKIILDKFSKRLSELIKDNNTDISLLTSNLGLKSKTTIYRYMKGEMSPKITTIKVIADIYNVNPVWLMGYDVPKMQNEVYKNKKNNSALVLVYGTIPAGIPMECIEDVIDTEEISLDMLKGDKQYFGLRVKGHSMEPDYLEGDTLILEKVDDCENGDDCVIMVNGNEGPFKRVFKNKNGIILQPLNTNRDSNGKLLYEPIPFTNEQIQSLPVKILGVVVEFRRKKKRY